MSKTTHTDVHRKYEHLHCTTLYYTVLYVMCAYVYCVCACSEGVCACKCAKCTMYHECMCACGCAHTSSYLQYDLDGPLLLQSTGVPQEELESLLHASPVLAGVAIG